MGGKTHTKLYEKEKEHRKLKGAWNKQQRNHEL